MEAIGLFKLQEQIRRVLALNFPEPLFIKAEISRVSLSRGHYYLELADKDISDEHFKAKAQAVLWKTTASRLKNKLKDQFEELIQEGLQIAFHARVQFHEVYGLKLLIEDIDLEYSLGVVAKERSEILSLLEKENLLTQNSQKELPTILQRIAVISSSSAAGYSDFLETIQQNPHELKFELQLFQAAMQGLSVEKEITTQLKNINNSKAEFDVVVIIRGGGGKLDLAYFDNYKIGKQIAMSDLPVFTGIGHQIDETVADRVSHTSFKTPTAVAEYIISHNLQFLQALNDLKLKIGNIAVQKIDTEMWGLASLKKEVFNLSRGIIQDQQLNLQYTRKELRSITKQIIEHQLVTISHLKERVKLMDPQKILERGFTATEQNGNRISSKQSLNPDKRFSLIFSDGKIEIKADEQ